MSTLVDSNVLIDVLSEDERWFEWSSQALAEAVERGVLGINPIIFAEVAVGFSSEAQVAAALPVPGTRVGILRRGLVIDQMRAVQAQRQPAFDIGLLRQQHPPHIAVLDDRHRLRSRIAIRGSPALQPGLRVVQRVAIAHVAEHGRAETDADARLVHHVEHAAQAFIRPPH